MTKVLILYYSSYGHIEKMANAVAEGVRNAGAEAVIKRVPELAPEEVARKSGFRLDQPAVGVANEIQPAAHGHLVAVKDEHSAAAFIVVSRHFKPVTVAGFASYYSRFDPTFGIRGLLQNR